MDLSSILGTLLSSDAISGVSQATHTSANDVQSVLSAAMPSLLQGAVAQSQDQATAESFATALADHSAADTSDLASFMNGVDLDDGAKIVQHLLGSNTSALTSQVAKQSSVTKAKTGSILSAAAPLLLSLLGQGTNASSSSVSTSMISSLMGGLLGGGQSQSSAGGSLLSSLLGGGQSQSSAGGSLLGSLLGGGQSQSQSGGGLLSGLMGALDTSAPSAVTQTKPKKKKTSSTSTTTAKKKKAASSSSAKKPSSKKDDSAADALGSILSNLLK